MGSRRDSYVTNDPMSSDGKSKGPSFGDVLAKKPEPTRGKPTPKMTFKPLPPEFVPKRKKP